MEIRDEWGRGMQLLIPQKECFQKSPVCLNFSHWRLLFFGTVNPLWEVAMCQPMCCTLWTHGFKFLEVVPSDQCLPLISRWTNCLQLNIWKNTIITLDLASHSSFSVLQSRHGLYSCLMRRKKKKWRHTLHYLSMSWVSHSYMSESSYVVSKKKLSKHALIHSVAVMILTACAKPVNEQGPNFHASYSCSQCLCWMKKKTVSGNHPLRTTPPRIQALISPGPSFVQWQSSNHILKIISIGNVWK